MANLKHQQTTELILKAFYAVYNELGYGFLENVYENAMVVELTSLGVKVGQQVSVEVAYKKQQVGYYQADLVADDAVIVELNAAADLTDKHKAQLRNYLKATRFEVGLLPNFGPEPCFKRQAFDNSRKGSLSWTQTSSSGCY